MKITKISASKWKTHIQCPFKHFLEYNLRLRGKAGFAAFYGTVIHEIYERYAVALRDGTDEKAWADKYGFKGDPKEAALTLEELDETWHEILLTEGWQVNDLWKEHRYVLEANKDCDSCPFFKDGVCGIVKQSVDTFDGCPRPEYDEGCRMVERVLYDESPISPFIREIVDTEQKFDMTIEVHGQEYVINGIIDLVTKLDDDTIEIFDYKTGRYKMSYPDCTKDPQLLLYYLACRRLYPEWKHILITIYYVNGGKKQITPPFGDLDEAKTIKLLQEKWHEIESDIMPVRRCDAKGQKDRFDFKCEKMCDIDTCKRVHPKFMQFITQGGHIDDLNSEADLDKAIGE